MDQWNKIESPEIDPHTYQSVSLQQRRQEYTMEGKVSLVSGVGKTDSCMKISEVKTLASYKKINSKLVKDLNMRYDTIKPKTWAKNIF